MKTLVGILLFGSILLPMELQAQRMKGGKDRDWSNRAAEIEGIADRAGGAHNKSNIGARS